MASPARAEIPEILKPAEGRAFWAAFSLGPAVNMYGVASQFKLSQTFGWHFGGEATGPAIALDLSEAFGSGFVTIDVAPRFVWDIHIIKTLGLYLSPGAGLGFSYSTWGSCVTTAGGGSWCPNQNWTAFHFTVAFDGKMIIGNRWLVIFRPMGIDGYVHPNGWALRYSIMFGGGAVF